MPDLHVLPPGALIKLVAKGVLYAEMDANMKEVMLKPHHNDCNLAATSAHHRLLSEAELCRTAALLKTITNSSVLLTSF